MIDPCDDPRTYAPVLGRMVELLGAPGSQQLSFGKALALASIALATPIPLHMEGPLLTAAFEIISSGKIPGLPEA